MADLQASQAEMSAAEENTMTADSAIAEETEPVSTETSNKKGGSISSEQVTACKREASLEKAPSQDLGKGWKTDLAEKEKLLNECKNQIRVSYAIHRCMYVHNIIICSACIYYVHVAR